MKKDHANMPGMDPNMPGMGDQAKKPEQGKTAAAPQKTPESTKPSAPASPGKGTARKP